MKERIGSRLVWLAGLILAGLLIAAACTGGDDGDGEATETAAPTETEEPDSDEVQASGTGLIGGLPQYGFGAAVSNSYWYSRYNLGNLTAMSGLGVTFAPSMDAIQAMVQMVDQGPEDGEHVTVPENPALLQAVFAGGDPRFVNAFNGNPGDFTNWRWDPAKMDTTLTPSAQAQTIIKEVEWAKFFNSVVWAGAVTDDFGAMDRFKGLVLFTEAKMQARFALENLRNPDGLFVAGSRFDDGTVTVVDDTVGAGDQYQMLQALSDLRMVLQNPDAYNNVYTDADALASIGAATDELFGKVRGLSPSGVEELALGAQATAWFAATTQDAALQSQALELLGDLGDQLINVDRADIPDRAKAVRGLLEAARVLDEQKYRDAALADLDAIIDAYHTETGSFEGVDTLSVWEVGDILGALDSALVNGGSDTDRTSLQRTFAGFFEAAVNLGGLLQAVIPKEMEASPFELERVTDDLFFAYPTIPTPDKAGGPYGTAAVDASEITFDEDSGTWLVSDRMFHTAGAMHASNEMFWTFSGTGFPQVELLGAGGS